MKRSSVLIFAMCAHAVCISGGDKELAENGFGEPFVTIASKASADKPVSLGEVYEKIKELVSYAPRRVQLLKDDEFLFDLLMRDLEEKFKKMPKYSECSDCMKKVCRDLEPNDNDVRRCGVLLAELMRSLKNEIHYRKLYRLTAF